MTLFLDSTALFSRYTEGPEHEVVMDAMRADPIWCISAVAHTECEMLLQRLDLDDAERLRIRGAIRSESAMFHIVPVDERCLERATDLGSSQPLRTIDAIQLAAADRLPRPMVFATFDPNQIGPALDLGFDVVSTLVDRTGRH